MNITISIKSLLVKGFEQPESRGAEGFSFTTRPGWNMKNDESLLALSMDSMKIDLLMRNNGGKKIYIRGKDMELLDYRLYSKMKIQNKVIYNKKKRLILSGMETLLYSVVPKLAKGPLKGDLVNEEEEKKVEKINKVKREMFNKHFSKDEYMNSIQDKIFTEGERNSEEEKNATKIPERGEEVRRDKGKSNKFSCASFWKMIACCKKKNKDKRTGVSRLDREPLVEIVGQDEEGVLDEEIPISVKSRVGDESRDKRNGEESIKEKKPSELFLERFHRKEARWFSSVLKEIRNFIDEKKAKNFQVDRDFIAREMMEYEIFIEFESSWDSETIVKMQMVNKKIILIPDFLWKILDFIKKPFSGSLILE